MTFKTNTLVAAALTLALAATLAASPAPTTGTAKAPPAKPAAGTTATKPAPATTTTSGTTRAPVIDMTTPGAKAIDGLSFLTGKWKGELRSLPLMMDIAIDGAVTKPGKTMSFDVHAKPSMGMTLPIDGDYRSVVSWSETHKSLRAVMTDAAGRGVEMTGGKVPDLEEWLFSSTEEGAPFPFKVRVKPVTKDQVIVAYTSGGRMPLKYEVTFNRVEG
jgi:hypothetical protein